MNITSIVYSRTRNLGNYESVKIEATIEVTDEADTDEAYAALRDWVLSKLAATPTHHPQP